MVSLTTHGRRLRASYVTIESIAAGRVRPSRIILWLDTETEAVRARNTPSLRRLIKRGLEIQVYAPIGPHSKYYAVVAGSYVHSVPLVTADDDVIYPSTWLEKLLEAYSADPDLIHCYRAHRLELVGDQIAPYMSWRPVDSKGASYFNFLTGVSGVIYPPKFLNYLHQVGDLFKEVCPNADDVWLNYQALTSGIPVSQLADGSATFPTVLCSQREALWRRNANDNDVYIRAVYSRESGALVAYREATLTRPKSVGR